MMIYGRKIDVNWKESVSQRREREDWDCKRLDSILICRLEGCKLSDCARVAAKSSTLSRRCNSNGVCLNVPVQPTADQQTRLGQYTRVDRFPLSVCVHSWISDGRSTPQSFTRHLLSVASNLDDALTSSSSSACWEWQYRSQLTLMLSEWVFSRLRHWRSGIGLLFSGRGHYSAENAAAAV